jgi:hypothetical protein
VEGELGYADTKVLDGYLGVATLKNDEQIVFATVMGGEQSNDHYPYYEFVFAADNEGLAVAEFQMFYEDIAGLEGMDWRGATLSSFSVMMWPAFTLCVFWNGVRESRWHKPLLYLWAAPATLLGLTLIPIALFQGGGCRRVLGVVEAHGGIITALLRRGLPWVGGGAAMTLGHVVLGRDESCLDYSRAHERVHVAQYERWGPFFIPLYLGASVVAYLRGGNPYLDNPFEREAFDRAERS